MLRVAVVCLIITLQGVAWADPPPAKSSALVAANAAILMDARTGLVLWEHNADARLPMASTTKIMTAMVILDRAAKRLDERVTISDAAYGVGWSTIFDAREVAGLGDMVRAILISSSNQAAVAVAEHLAGSEEAFVAWMNEKARDLHLQHTHFANTHGLHVEGHYSSARDLAVMTRHALAHYPLIRETVARGYPKPLGIQVEPRGNVVLWNKNKLLGTPVPGVAGSTFDGVKTGYVRASGACLVSSAKLGDWQLIGVLLNSPDLFGETRTLLQYGFSRYQWMTYADEAHGLEVAVKRGAVRAIEVGAVGGLGAPMPRNAGAAVPSDVVVFEGVCRAPIRQGERVGTLVLQRDGHRIASAPAVALQAVRAAWWVRVLAGVGYTLGALVSLAILGRIYGTLTKIARRRRRRALAPPR